MTDAEIQAAIDAIDQAIADGAVLQSFTVAGQTFEFRSIADMLRARAHFVALLAVAAGTTSNRFRFAQTSKGA